MDLGTLAELALTLAGFSALIAIVQGGSVDRWPPRTLNAFWLVISVAIGAFVLCFVPTALRGIGVASYPTSQIVLIVYILTAFGYQLKRSRQLTLAGHPPPSRPSWVLGGAISAANLSLQAASLAGVGRPEQLYNLGVAFVIFTALIPLAVILRAGREDSV